MSRDMGAMMTAIIMAGRTGAAFAAQLGSMKVTQEIDALTTMGISPLEFLVLPRVLALFLMMPLLCVYSDCLGVAGGAFVSAAMLHIPLGTYMRETQGGDNAHRHLRRRIQGRGLRHYRRGRRMPAWISVRQQLVGGRRRGDRGGGHGNRLRNRRVRNLRLRLQRDGNLGAYPSNSQNLDRSAARGGVGHPGGRSDARLVRKRRAMDTTGATSIAISCGARNASSRPVPTIT